LSATALPRQGSQAPAGGGEQGAERCPVCSAQLAADQDWCLQCGAAARTRLAPPPHWRPLVSLLVLVIVAALIGLALALAKLAGASPTSGSLAPGAVAIGARAAAGI